MKVKAFEQLLKILKPMCKNIIDVEYIAFDKKIKSKFGGKPSVPKDFEWPYFDTEDKGRKALTFLTEINLSEIAELDTENLLPKSGLLSFFYEMDSQEWGFDPKNKGCARVFYFENESELMKRDFPEDFDKDYILPELSMVFKKNKDIPSCLEATDIPAIKKVFTNYSSIIDDEYDFYDEFKNRYKFRSSALSESSKILGYPNVMQNPMEEQCEYVTRGYYLGRSRPELSLEEKKDIEKASKEWILLFQMGTVDDGDFALEFGSCGLIYFWIKKEDLRNKNFDNIWLILQCS